MERTAFTLLHESERSWWYRGRAAVVRAVLKRLPARPRRTILDFGAGFGGMHDTLSRYGTVSAFEPDEQARASASVRGYERIFGTVDPALAQPYDLIALCDVLEHIEDDRAFLARAKHALAPDGALLVTVPAMPFLWSVHDVSHHHFRRYTKRSLRDAFEESGYEVVFISYWNALLFPAAALARMLGKGGESSFRLPRVIDACFYLLVWIESLLLCFISLPFGVSLVALVYRK
jgi:SAM-dependent methyltransferase